MPMERHQQREKLRTQEREGAERKALRRQEQVGLDSRQKGSSGMEAEASHLV